MKKIMFISMLVAGTQASWANDYGTLTIAQTSGTTTSLTAVGTQITFSNGNLVATSGDTTVTIALTDLASMYFADSTTAISTLQQSGLTINTDNRSVTITSSQGGKAIVANLSGQTMGSASLTPGATTTVASGLQPGVYVIKTDKQTIKAIVR